MTAGRRLMVFGKVPEPGRVKTRLEPALGAEGAAELYDAFLEDTVALSREVPAERELWLAAGPDGGWDPDRRFPGVPLRRQPEGGLGDRLRGAFAAAFEEGVARALVIGSDHPTLPPGHVREAFEALDGADACVGPSPDGGYWAVGLHRRAWPGAGKVFVDIPWSTAEVLDVTARRAEEHGIRLRCVSSWYDVDEPGDLERLRRDVRPGSATAGVLAELGAVEDA